jgi:RND family efflux transporter MFP subunit
MRGKKFKLAAVGVLAALGAAAVVYSGTATKREAAKVENVETAKAKPALTVTATLPHTVAWPRSLTTNGNIVAWQEVVIGAEIGGLRLTEVLVNVGDKVKRGQLLARISSDTVDADLAQGNAAVAEEEAMLAEAVANGDRARQLQSTGLISAQQITQSLTAEQTAKARLAAARARVQSTELHRSQTRVYASDHGVISARTATVGSLAQPGQELFRLIRQNRLEWRAEVTAAELPRILTGQTVTVEVADGITTQGRVRIGAPTVDPQTRIGLVYVDLPPDSPARAGTFARGVFELGAAPALTLPQSAVLLREGFSYVFKVDNNSQVAQTKVTTGRRIEDQVEITAGLEPNTRVVANGVGFLTDGDTVRVVDAQAASK